MTTIEGSREKCCGRSIECCAYGGTLKTILPLVLCPVAVIFSWSYTFSCRFWRVRLHHDDDANDADDDDSNGYPYYLGLYYVETFDDMDVEVYQRTGHSRTDDECVYWSDHPYWEMSDMDTPWRWSRAASILVCVFGFILMVLVLGLACCRCHVNDIYVLQLVQVLFGCLVFTALVSK